MIVDQGQALLGGMQVVPDFGAIQARNQQLELQRMAIEQRNQAAKQEFLQMQREQQQQVEWTQTVAELERDPRPENIRRAMLRFPQMRETLTSTFADMGQGDLRQIGALYRFIETGDTAGAINLVEQRIAADTAAGRPDPEDQAALEALRSGDTAAINRLRTGLGILIASHPQGDDFLDALGKLGGGDANRTPTWRAGQDAYDDAIRRGATPQQAEERRNRVIDALEQNATNPLMAVQPGGLVGTTNYFRGQAEGGDPASGVGGGNPAPAATPEEIGAQAERTGTITQEGADIIRSALGPNGQAQFNSWLQETGVRVIGAPVRVRSIQQAEALPPGTRFIDPDGVERIR